MYCLKRMMSKKEGMVSKRVYAIREGIGVARGLLIVVLEVDSEFLHPWHGLVI